MKKDIIYFTNGAAGNVGNVFIDLGSIQSLKMACPNSSIYTPSHMSKVIFHSYGRNVDNAFDIATAIEADHAVFSGMMLNRVFIKIMDSTISKLVENNTKLIING